MSKKANTPGRMIDILHRNSGSVIAHIFGEVDDYHHVLGNTLRGSPIHGASLSMIEMNGADIARWFFMDTSIAQSRLRGALAIGTTFSFSDLSGTDLSEADLSSSEFPHTDLSGVSLQKADLSYARFDSCVFNGTDFAEALCDGTSFIDCQVLSSAKGLDKLLHRGPSPLDAQTLRACIHELPDTFLQGCGYTQHEIDYLRALYRDNPIAMYSCFISHAEADLPFAQRLLADLRQNNVTCWHYKDSLRGGRDWQPQIDEAIKVHDKLILVCSRQSVYRENVVKEIIRAIDVERETGEQKLFPIRLDDHILSPAMMEEAREMVTTRVWRENWVVHIKRKHTPDFSGWDKDNPKYTQELNNLLRDLRQSA